MRQIYTVFMLFITSIGMVPAQVNDTIRIDSSYENSGQSKTKFINTPYAGLIVPAVTISYGFLAHNVNALRQFDINTQQKVQKHFTGKIHADDYMQYAPAVAVYGLDLFVKAKHNFVDRTFLMTTSYIISSASIHAVKRFTHIQRPNGSNHLSFPSGHTSTAFVGAHLLFKEYKDTSPWIGVTGYAVAGCIGAIRIYNNRHWFSDVVAGAGFGMLSVEVSYLLLPVFHRIIGDKGDQPSFSIAPVVGFNNYYGVGIACTF